MGFERARVESSAERLRDGRRRLNGRGTVVRGWEPAHLEMAEALREPPEDIAGVIARLKVLQQILDTLPPSPGNNRVAAFNSLYLTITEQVADHLRGPDVTDARWLEVLDVEFARLYFTALASWARPDGDTPDAWEVLFCRAHDGEVTALEAAVLGVNAHINHDLALALVATWRRLGYPGDGPQHPDYLVVNKIFYKHIPPLRRRFATAWQMQIDRCVGDLDDWTQRVLVRTTRAMAWEQAERLWELQDDKDDLARAHTVMDRVAAIAGETLLTGVGIVRVLWLTATAAVTRTWRRVRRRTKALSPAGAESASS
ncbi:DUF5995 family protein [Actinoplanes aureus]|uniref:Uncharacterized protein n=1 Tax=Actinoplanes aureus TaxID=2792083 RepID=A0A931CCA3_9ACTN|nr:DUF5995 family protein [Actinoplanes aureus]MBG0564711.1 hypothetical protein [Actinoplanes aureus]